MRTTILPFALLLSACGAPLPPGSEGGLPTDAASSTDAALPADAASPRCKTAADCNKANTDCCEGACIDIGSDPTNCGGCGKACHAVIHGAPACTAGQCSATCDPDFGDCDKSLMNGCEADLTSDSAHCGACETSCAGLPNAQSACVKSTCGVSSCNQGFADCDNKPLNGCEVNLGSDPANCGGCAKTCPKYANASPVCMNGGCSLGACAMGFADCDNLPANGCETATDSDLANCGACGKVCATPHGTPACVMGACTIAACAMGYSDCDQMAATGCEVQISTDPANCGMCGKACPIPANASASCSNSACAAACKFGFADCNKNLGDGCEAPLATDAMNCGQCGAICPAYPNASPGCSAGMCGIGMCQGLFGNCDGNVMNGCEKSLAADVNNCGACGKVCNFQNAQGACLNGQCGINSCNNGFGDCDGNGANGCEANFGTDKNTCGMCGKACPQNQTCVNSVCTAQQLCSAAATAWCVGKGWQVMPWKTSFPNQPGGAIFCTSGVGAGNDCDTCNTYNEIVWKNGAQDACNSNPVLTPGTVYAGHSPCSCSANNLLNCGQWPLNNCIPD